MDRRLNTPDLADIPPARQGGDYARRRRVRDWRPRKGAANEQGRRRILAHGLACPGSQIGLRRPVVPLSPNRMMGKYELVHTWPEKGAASPALGELRPSVDCPMKWQITNGTLQTRTALT